MCIQGWTREDREYLRLFLWRHGIIYEKLYDLSACTENVEYSLHLPDDIVCHPPWTTIGVTCLSVKCVITKCQTTNKSLCKTYADSVQQLYFVNTYLQGAEYLVTTVV